MKLDEKKICQKIRTLQIILLCLVLLVDCFLFAVFFQSGYSTTLIAMLKNIIRNFVI